ncbi:DMT family transporter [Ramlibacter sp. AN1015]|uniref:DMT family transporter n=1 Tax=Ramlibacter sp. AN1015 TaxID=3133428 RepID=UPI0030BC83E8
MHQSLSARNALLLALPPLLWASNAVVGRLVAPLVPPLTLNLLRWAVAFLVLLPLASWALRPGSGLWSRWRRYGLLGLLGVGLYNSLQYLALKTSTPVNVTLVASSIPVFMLLIGMLFFGQRPTRRQLAGAGLSIVGVLLVLSHGDLGRLASVRFVPGDVYMLLATASWAWYSWLLTRTAADDPALRSHWAGFLMAQIAFGLLWASAFTAGEWLVLAPAPVQWGWPLAAAVLFVALGPSLLAYRLWGLGVQRVGPNLAGLFSNLAPLFAALLSATFIGERPQAHHAVAFSLIVAGIVVSSRRPAARPAEGSPESGA